MTLTLHADRGYGQPMNSSRRKPQNPEVRRILGLPPENEQDRCSGVNGALANRKAVEHTFDCEGHAWTLFDYGDVLYIEHASHEWDAELTRDGTGAWRFGAGATEHIAKCSTAAAPAALEAYIAKRGSVTS